MKSPANRYSGRKTRDKAQVERDATFINLLARNFSQSAPTSIAGVVARNAIAQMTSLVHIFSLFLSFPFFFSLSLSLLLSLFRLDSGRPSYSSAIWDFLLISVTSFQGHRLSRIRWEQRARNSIVTFSERLLGPRGSAFANVARILYSSPFLISFLSSINNEHKMKEEQYRVQRGSQSRLFYQKYAIFLIAFTDFKILFHN